MWRTQQALNGGWSRSSHPHPRPPRRAAAPTPAHTSRNSCPEENATVGMGGPQPGATRQGGSEPALTTVGTAAEGGSVHPSQGQARTHSPTPRSKQFRAPPAQRESRRYTGGSVQNAVQRQAAGGRGATAEHTALSLPSPLPPRCPGCALPHPSTCTSRPAGSEPCTHAARSARNSVHADCHRATPRAASHRGGSAPRGGHPPPPPPLGRLRLHAGNGRRRTLRCIRCQTMARSQRTGRRGSP